MTLFKGLLYSTLLLSSWKDPLYHPGWEKMRQSSVDARARLCGIRVTGLDVAIATLVRILPSRDLELP